MRMKQTEINPIDKKYGNAMLVVVMAMMFLFFIVQTLFNTKGEPREAIVAVSMLNSGNWILPVSFGADIPYKPPMLAWCIAAVSWILGGEVTEFSSRLPSVVAAAVMVVATNRFFRRNSGSQLVGAATAWITISSLEVFRAATACRVDMLLTMFIVTATYLLFGFFQRGCRGGLPWLAIAAMSGAALTKGPVGVGLPCLVIGIYRLMCGDRFLPLAGRLVAAGLLACVLPALWYVAAWQQGGEGFLDLAMEENLGRLTGTMSYASHENPVYYNFLTIIAGMVPYTLLALLSLVAVRWRTLREDIRRCFARRGEMSQLTLFALVAALTILVFYSIPKSKRSVYLLPMYPFMAYFVVLLIGWLSREREVVLKWFARIMAAIAVIIPVAYMVLLTGVLDSVDAVARLGFSQDFGMASVGCMLGLITVFIGVGSWRGTMASSGSGRRPRLFEGYFGDASMSILAIYMMLNIAVLPTLLSAKSDRCLVAHVAEYVAPDDTLYSFVASDMLRFYTLNFYLGDRIRLIEREKPDSGVMIAGKKDFDVFVSAHGSEYRFRTLYEGEKKGCDVRQVPILVEFIRK